MKKDLSAIPEIKKLALEFANGFVGIKEQGSNRGKEIDTIQKEFGMQGQQYCVMFCLYCYILAFQKLGFSYKGIIPHIASSQTLFEEAKKPSQSPYVSAVYYDPKNIKKGDLVIWRKRLLWKGHAGIIESVNEDFTKITTIEGNTANSDFGNQRDGDGIYRRIRKTSGIGNTSSNFYIRGFISMERFIEIKFIDNGRY